MLKQTVAVELALPPDYDWTAWAETEDTTALSHLVTFGPI